MLECEVLELEVERVQAQTVRNRRVDVERLARDPAAVRRRHRVQRAHVVEPVGEFDQDDADVLRHREQHLAEALGLRVLARVELDLVQLRDAVDHVGDGLAERRFDLGLGDRGVLHHVVKEGGGKPLRVQAPLRQDARDRQRMRDVGLAGLAELAAVGRVRELPRALDERDVRRRQVIAEVSGELRDFRHARSLRLLSVCVAGPKTWMLARASHIGNIASACNDAPPFGSNPKGWGDLGAFLCCAPSPYSRYAFGHAP